MSFIYQWIDVLWLPVAFFTVHKQQRWYAAGFIIFCMLMMRLQIELLSGVGYGTGILNFMSSDIFPRSLVTYSVIYILYLLLAYYSPNTRSIVFMGASISIFFFALVSSMIVMVL